MTTLGTMVTYGAPDATVTGTVTLTATAAAPDIAATADGRTRLFGLLLPFGTVGRSSIGPVSVDASSDIAMPPPERLPLVMHHDRTRPVAVADVLTTDAQGISVVWLAGRTADAAEAVSAVRDGLITGQSVELSNVVLSPAATPGQPRRIESAQLDAAALVTVPAFADARLSAIVPDPETAAAAPTPKDDAMPPVDMPPVELDATAPPAPIVAAAPRQPLSQALTVASAADLIAAAITGRIDPGTLTAALADATAAPTSLGTAIAPQWVGKLWDDATAPRPHIDKCTGPRPLTGLKVTGYRVKAPLRVGTWTGDKSDIPTNAPTTEAVEESVQRWAGGVDVGREIIDLGHGDIIADLLAQAVDDYRVKSDLACLSDLLAGATAVTPAPSTLMSAVIAVLRKLRETRRPAAVIWVATDVLDAELDALQTLRWRTGDLTIDGGNPYGITVTADPDLPDGTVLGMATGAATFYESGPVRVNALDMSKGGFDQAVFGYTATLINRPAAVVKAVVTAPSAG